jgi:hypothetical protein
METFNYKKESLIYIKNNSIPLELCNEIKNKYESENDKVFLQNESYYYISKDNNKWSKLIILLTKELNTNLNIFLNKINSKINFDKDQNNNYIFETVKPYNLENNYYFKIEKQEFVFENTRICKNKKYSQNIKIFKFIWFLDQDDKEIIFWNNYKIDYKIGTLLIFPVSWCFPYEELNKLNTNSYTISGFIYEK